MILDHALGQATDFALEFLTCPAGTQRLQTVLQFSRITTRNFGMPFLMSLDIGRERVPDQAERVCRLSAIDPVGQGNMGLQRDVYVADRAVPIRFEICHFTAKLDLRGAGMPETRRAGQWAMLLELIVQIVCRSAADREIGIGLRDARTCASEQWNKQNDEHCAENATDAAGDQHSVPY